MKPPTSAQERILRDAAKVLQDMAREARISTDEGVTYTGELSVREGERYEFLVRTERAYLHVLYRRDLLPAEKETSK